MVGIIGMIMAISPFSSAFCFGRLVGSPRTTTPRTG
jgi:hypothetical protein